MAKNGGYDAAKDKVIAAREAASPALDWNGNPQGYMLRLVSYDGGPVKLDVAKWYVDPKTGSRVDGRVNRMECDPGSLRALADQLQSLAAVLEAKRPK